MRLIFAKRTTDRIEFGIIYGAICLLLIAAARFLPVLDLAPECVFKKLTSVSCPTCGATRSLVLVSHGDLAAALAMNPLTALCVIVTPLFFLYGMVTLLFDLPHMTVLITDTEQDRARVSVLTALLLQWCYLILR